MSKEHSNTQKFVAICIFILIASFILSSALGYGVWFLFQIIFAAKMISVVLK